MFALGASVIAQAEPARVRPPSVGIFAFSLPSALNIDIEHETVTLPLHEGRTTDGRALWYVVTESSDQADATRSGVNYSNKLLNAVGTAAVQKVHFHDGGLVFEGTVNFGLTHVLVPGPNGFPPTSFAAGAAGDAKYTPLVQIVADKDEKQETTAPAIGVVLNAPQVANETGRSGSVVAIDYERKTVTLNMLGGWVDGQFTLYLHTDASSELVAALESSTYTPNLNAAPGIANDEPPSSRAAIIPVVNGIRGDGDPMRQGLESALLGEGDPFNVAQEQPSDPVHYTPIWDVSPVQWTAAAIAAGLRVQLHSQDTVRTQALAGNIVSALPGTPDVGLGGINASGSISNCPIMVVFPGGVAFSGGVE
ncbi:MAG: hypothetical protein WA642_21900 [Steroidobacteraceae bacterium]